MSAGTRSRRWSTRATALTAIGALSIVACSSDASDDASGNLAAASSVTPKTVDDRLVPTVSQLKAWQAQIDSFDHGYRPVGSPAHEGYIRTLTGDLNAFHLQDVHTESYNFNKWTTTASSLVESVGSSSSTVQVAAPVPYSGTTSSEGVSGELSYLALPESLVLTSASISNAFENPISAAPEIVSALAAALHDLESVRGKIVVFQVPMIELPPSIGAPVYENDPGKTIDPHRAQVGLSALMTVPLILDALALAGASGGVGILNGPTEEVDGMAAPFFGVTGPNFPALYVGRQAGANLKQSIAEGESSSTPPSAKLVLQGSIMPATSENIVATIPGMSKKEIVLSTHSDGPNSIEDNGTVGLLALTSYLTQLPIEERQKSVRIVISGGHFAGSRGLREYVSDHTLDLAETALAAIEIEHIGALEWNETSPGVMGLTGLPETQYVNSWTMPPLQNASIAFCKTQNRCLVGLPSFFGEGAHYLFVPLIQFITSPNYLLLGEQPDATARFTDFALMRRMISSFVQMELSLDATPNRKFGLAGLIP